MSTEKPNSHLTSGRVLAGNTMWNLLGMILPTVVGLFSIPLIIRKMGVSRFGLLSLAWILVGYFSLFDLGIGRALTKLVADKLGANEEHSIAPLAWTSLLLMFLLGVFGTFATLFLSPLLVHRLLKIPHELQNEALQSFYILALSIPVVTVTAGFRGILEALQHFRVVNLIRIPMSIFSFAGPLLVLPFARGLVPVVAVLVLGRLLGCGAHIWACFGVMPALRRSHSFHSSFIIPLMRFGSWMTIHNVVGPLLCYMDRFLIGAILSVSAVAYYTTPVDMVLRLVVIPSAVVGVLFPAFAVTLSQNPKRSGMLLARGLKYVFLVVFPVVLVIVTFAPEGLRYWLGPTFSVQATAVLRWAAAGVFINSLSTLPFVLIQSAGRPDITSLLLAVELPVYGVALWFLTKRLGIEGTAIAWTGRYVVEAIVVFFLSHRLLPHRPRFLVGLGVAVATGLLLFYVGTIPHSLTTKASFLAGTLAVFGIVGWSVFLGAEEKAFMIHLGSRTPARQQTVVDV